MDQNTRKFSNQSYLLAIFIAAVVVASVRFISDSIVLAVLVGVPLGALLGIVVRWLIPIKCPLSPERYGFWHMLTSMGCFLVLALACLLRGDLNLTFLFVAMGSLSLLLDYMDLRHQKTSRE